MSLCKLPDTGYTYLSIESNEPHNAGFEWNAGLSKRDNAQYWIDIGLGQERYVPAVWWKFWKPTITFKVFACGGTVDPFYKTVRLQEKQYEQESICD